MEKELIITLEMAKKLKELGFNKYCQKIYEYTPLFSDEIYEKYPGWYFEEIKDEIGEDYEKYVHYEYILTKGGIYFNNKELENNYTCPDILDVFEWLRQEHGIIITVLPFIGFSFEGLQYKFYINITHGELLKNKTETDDIFYKTYEEARFKAIEYALLNEEFSDKVWKK